MLVVHVQCTHINLFANTLVPRIAGPPMSDTTDTAPQVQSTTTAMCTDAEIISKLKSFSGIYVIGYSPLHDGFAERFTQYYGIEAQLVNSAGIKASLSVCPEELKHAKNALILSVYNTYLFPEDMTKNNTIINFHNALLPWHRGLRAAIWPIWAGDSEAGMTWHKVDAGIDTGALLAQRSTPIDETTESSYLANAIHELALESMTEAIENCLKGITIKPNREVTDELHGYHGYKDLPNNGIFERTWDRATASRFLRAMLLAKLKNIPAPKIEVDGQMQDFLKWKFKGDVLTIKTTTGAAITIDYS